MSLLIHLPRFRRARAAMRELAERERWPRDRIESWQLNKLNDVWKTAKQQVPYYRQLADTGSLPDRFDSLDEYFQRMPLLDKRVVRDSPTRFLSKTPSRGSWHRTGGSTGVPMRVYWEQSAHQIALQAKYRMLQQWDVDIFDRSTFLWGHSGSIAPGLKGVQQRIRRPIEDRLRRRQRLSAYRLGPSDLDQHLIDMRQFEPRSLYGYSSAVTLLADRAAENRISVPSLRVAIMTAEPADPDSVRRTSGGLDCEAAIEYGSVECGLLATTCSDGSLRVREDQVIVETVRTDRGPYGLVVTVLNNPSFPLLRYRIEDIASGPIRRPDQGFSILEQVIGRSNDLLLSRNGQTVHSMAVKHVLEHYPSIRRFRAYQDSTGDLRVTIETQRRDELPIDAITEKLTRLMEGYRVSVSFTDAIGGNLAGKHRWIVSELVSAAPPAR